MRRVATRMNIFGAPTLEARRSLTAYWDETATIAGLGWSGVNWNGDGSKLDGVVGKVIDGLKVGLTDPASGGIKSVLSQQQLVEGQQPGIDPADVRRVIEAPTPIAVCRYDDGRGHPIAFHRSLFGEPIHPIGRERQPDAFAANQLDGDVGYVGEPWQIEITEAVLDGKPPRISCEASRHRRRQRAEPKPLGHARGRRRRHRIVSGQARDLFD